jgi:hypothetical protein
VFTRVLDEVIAQRGLPQAIRCDNGPELTSRHFLAWALEWKIELATSSPDAPCRTATWRASTEGCARSVCAPAGSRTASMHVPRSQTGERSTTKSGPTAASTTELRPSLLNTAAPGAMEKTRAMPAWETPPASPTFPQLRRRRL